MDLSPSRTCLPRLSRFGIKEVGEPNLGDGVDVPEQVLLPSPPLIPQHLTVTGVPLVSPVPLDMLVPYYTEQSLVHQYEKVMPRSPVRGEEAAPHSPALLPLEDEAPRWETRRRFDGTSR
ncbi:hypothetical protein BHE74_00027554 [Ensete ventricosum]|nr:hypothetical protein BHE74_00027554 [Ensete ventricosum]